MTWLFLRERLARSQLWPRRYEQVVNRGRGASRCFGKTILRRVRAAPFDEVAALVAQPGLEMHERGKLEIAQPANCVARVNPFRVAKDSKAE